jgi:hypothetical protein
MRNIDFDEKTLVIESCNVALSTYGGFGYNDLREMGFDTYLEVIARLKEGHDGE